MLRSSSRSGFSGADARRMCSQLVSNVTLRASRRPSHHRRRPYDLFCERETFQISPHTVQRQYASASGRFAVVRIDVELQAGHTEGGTGSASDADGRFEESKSLTGAPHRCFGEGWRPGWPQSSGKRIDPSIRARRTRLPWIPHVRLHNPFPDPRNGDEFLEPFFRAALGDMQPFILVVEGSIPGEPTKPRVTGRRSAPI